MESEAFLLGIWKDYQELEESISMQELTAVLVAKHNADYESKKFAAALKGVNLDEQNGVEEEEVTFESFKDKVMQKHGDYSSNDILSLQGGAAEKLGFGIGMGLDYELIE